MQLSRKGSQDHVLTNVHMLGSQHSAKHPANTSPLTELGCPDSSPKTFSVNKARFCWSPVRQTHHHRRERGIWRRDGGVGGVGVWIRERERERASERKKERRKEGKCLGGGEGQGNWDRGLDNCSTMEIVFDLWGVQAYLVGNVPGSGML